MTGSHYQVGGSLTADSPSYVIRPADNQLYQALKQGEFCYVLNCHQMGKSSLMVRIKHRLQQEGYRCAAIDLTRIGSEGVVLSQWYNGIMGELWRGFRLVRQFPLKSWRQEIDGISVQQRLSDFIENILLTQFPQENLVIFVDEIDSILSLDFSVDDFFAWIQFCYDQRAINSQYRRLCFAIFGVATPNTLIQDKTRTPFNIGRAIELQGLQLADLYPLAQGLTSNIGDIQAIFRAVLDWTGGQPFLTQKLCQLLGRTSQRIQQKALKIPSGMEEFWVENMVYTQIIHRWESRDEPEHLQTIRDRLLHNPQWLGRILGIYQQLLTNIQLDAPAQSSQTLSPQPVPVDDSPEQTELLLSGLVIKQAGFLQIRNRIYQEVFDQAWVNQQLSKLRPYSQTFAAWIAQGRSDPSRLLRGQALKDAQAWSKHHHLSDLDYQFLAASEARDRQETQQALEARRTLEVIARLEQEKKATRLHRYLLGSITGALVIVSVLGLAILLQYRRALESQFQANRSAIQALVSSSKSLAISGQGLDTLVEAIRAKRLLEDLAEPDPDLTGQTDAVLRQAIYGAVEFNRFSGHGSSVNSVGFSPDGQTLVTGSADRTVRLWQQDGTLLESLRGHTDEVYAVQFSPDGRQIVSASGDNRVKLWDTQGHLLKTIDGHRATVWFVRFSPDGQRLATASQDGTVKLWTKTGQLLKTLNGHRNGVYGLSFSSDGQWLASASIDGTAKVWRADGTLVTTLKGHQGAVWAVAFRPGSRQLVTTGQDKTIRLWSVPLNNQPETSPTTILEGHGNAIWGVNVSPDGEFLVSTSVDKTAKVWNWQGQLLQTLVGHKGVVWGVDISSDSRIISTAGWDHTVRLWYKRHPLVQTIQTVGDPITAVDFTMEGEGEGTANQGESNQERSPPLV
ncbi:MAG: hypothetical protein HC835_05220 [Oscillatoriales cyanobacterium RM2_1_1]|nr:hypothetical protein [Oscillatoriales cyanobacterium SM2_3_0]NJO45064.1 hypothetical protein [Oscillatoriales cyanobacterium RM2_1_1]